MVGRQTERGREKFKSASDKQNKMYMTEDKKKNATRFNTNNVMCCDRMMEKTEENEEWKPKQEATELITKM